MVLTGVDDDTENVISRTVVLKTPLRRSSVKDSSAEVY